MISMRGKSHVLSKADLSRSVAVMSIVALMLTGSASAQKAEDVLHIYDIRLMRKLGEYDVARGYLETILASGGASENVRRQAYNELVTIAYLTEGSDSTRSAAREALTEFPDLEAPPSHYPEHIQEIYEDLRKIMYGRLRLSSDPHECKVYLDGEEIGSTPLEGIYVAVGEHVVRISKFGYEDETIDVSIEPGSESEHATTLRIYHDIPNFGLGLEFGLSLMSLNYSGGTEGIFAGIGIVEDSERVARIGGGISLHMFRRDRFAVQAGLRYVSHGNRVHFRTYDGSKSSPYDSYYRYLAVPLLVKYYLIPNPRIFLCAGPEFGFMISAEISRADGGETTDIMDHVQKGQVSFTFGTGYEIEIAGHYLMISAYHTRGMLSLRNSTIWTEIDYAPREWRIAVSLIFNG